MNISKPIAISGRTLHIDADMIAYQSACADDMLLDLESRIEDLRSAAQAESVVLHLTMGHKGGRELITGHQESRKKNPDLDMKAKVHQLRVHMCKMSNGVPHFDQEADDGICQAMLADSNAVLWSMDKDLYMVGGMHLNGKTGIVESFPWGYGECWIDKSTTQNKVVGCGTSFFWHQMLMGDSSDGVSGVPRVGPVKAHELLSGATSDAEAFRVVWSEYTRAFSTTQSSADEMLGNAFILWIRRKHGEDIREFIKEMIDEI